MPKKGEIYYVFAKDLDVDGHEQDNDRPYVIVSRDAINVFGTNVVGVPLTTKLHKANSHRILIQAAHMIQNSACQRQLRDSVALTDHVRVLDPRRFESPKMGHMTDTAVGAIELALAFLFDIR
ncbi:MAG TPA: type II toxin-antitoxin system PemK/MazF family toxin [Bryobacteraceae bacterium]|nr:type II toxin-antitoxin system PemK/MazF family toxin [Bryobacteraceae bacterium]